jgi:hypothetical protein
MHEDCEKEGEKRRRWKERTPHPVVDDKTLFLYSPFFSNPSFSPPALQVFLLLNKRLYTRGEQMEVFFFAHAALCNLNENHKKWLQCNNLVKSHLHFSHTAL